MQVIDKLPFNAPVNANPGDTLHVFIGDENVLAAKIKQKQTFDTAIVVEDIPCGNLEATRGYFIGESIS